MISAGEEGRGRAGWEGREGRGRPEAHCEVLRPCGLGAVLALTLGEKEAQ